MIRAQKAALFAAVCATPCLLCAQAPVGELYSTIARVRGSVTLANSGTTVLSGSSIDSGQQPASLALSRGGSLIICQGTSASVSASADGRNLMFSFGSGAIETHYHIAASSDSIVTPDFRFVITGPGDFDLAISITPQGDTCVRSSHVSTGGLIVNEQMGDGSYQVKPNDAVVFHHGRVSDSTSAAGQSCGCPPAPAPRRQVQVADEAPPPPAPAAGTMAAPPAIPRASTAPAEHIVAEAPFVFNADGTPPPPTARVMKLRVEGSSFGGFYVPVEPPRQVVSKPAKKGFWRRFAKALFG